VTGIEQLAGRTAAKVGEKLFGAVQRARRTEKVRLDSRAFADQRVADDFAASLDAGQTERLVRYLNAPDFEEIALQLTLMWLFRDQNDDEVEPSLRDEIRIGLKHAVGLTREQLTMGSDIVLASLLVGVLEATRGLGRGDVDKTMAAGVAHIAAATAANTRLLERVTSLAGFHEFGAQLREQVAKSHGAIRMPHLGLHRSIPYDGIYVRPSLEGVSDLSDLISPGRRSVVLGDPGAGKSTLVAKLAWDVATRPDARVPFLLVLRNFATSFREGGRGLAWYLERLCQDPYNLTAPADAVEYLLGNGRAIVFLDGVDELKEPELRRRFAELVESFVHLYPLVPIVVTARKIGYRDAPLDVGLFSEAVIEEFDEERVERYTHNWFAWSEGTAEHERPLLARAFLDESRSVDELRTNPLLLGLLCNMYAHEHYIPTNLAEVYEKCALMLFEQWDLRRGIGGPRRFHGRLRSAVRYLAWEQFTAEESGVGWPRRRIVRMLSEFLERREYRPDEAEEDAEQFVDFCSGRPWVLTDIGGGESEPRYGFAHRTFMEYFAAEHLVRAHPTAASLWAVLRPQVAKTQWEVVAQIALQLFDEHDDRASEVLRLIIDDDDITVLGFAARALGYLTPTPGVLRALVETFARAATARPVESLFNFWNGTHANGHDWPLRTAWNSALPANMSIVQEVVIDQLSASVARGNDSALVLSYYLGLPSTAVEKWASNSRWAFLVRPQIDLGDAVRKFGPSIAYAYSSFKTQVPDEYPWHSVDPTCFIDAPLPWLEHEFWWPGIERLTGIPMASLWSSQGAELLFQLPDLETYERYPEKFISTNEHFVMFELVNGRKYNLVRQGALVTLKKMGVPEKVRDFFDRWMRHEFNVIG
jgi:hypothetical protein